MDSKHNLREPSLSYTNSVQYAKTPEKQNILLQTLGTPHVDSFNFILDKGIDVAIRNLIPVEFLLPNNNKIKIIMKDCAFSKPKVPVNVIGVRSQKIFPTECRQRGATYKAEFTVKIDVFLNERILSSIDKSMGEIPIMVKSDACHLSTMSPSELIKANEHADEWGGYFIIKGYEKLVRMLLLLRKNYPIAIKRPTWKGRGLLFSEFGIQIRCVTEDHTAVNNVLHYLTNGTAKLMFTYRKVLYYAPLILIIKCLVDMADYHIYELLTRSRKDDSYFSNCVQNMLRELHTENLHTQKQCKQYLGKMFRVKFLDLAPWLKDEQVTDFILTHCILIHLKDHEDKFNLLVFMTQKLFDFSQKKCATEGADAVMMQELLLGGHLYLQILKDKLQTFMYAMKAQMMKKVRNNPNFELTTKELLSVVRMCGSLDTALEYFFATGNISSNSGLGLMQDKGLSIVAENINRMRYMSHFRSVHRGAFFMGMRTTEARQLLPDAWGFVCPVHTPDGAPCGLLNHLTMQCVVTQTPDSNLVNNLPQVLVSLGMQPLSSGDFSTDSFNYPVLLDGRFLGYLPSSNAESICERLRQLKVDGKQIPFTTEIVLVPKKQVSAQYAGLFLFTAEARMMRPVINLAYDKVEFIGTFEQVYLNVAVTKAEVYTDKTTHLELTKSSFLSNLALLIPMPDCNQSPRNMYQCQMGKQTMGTPCHTWNIQADTKLYRLQTPASPLFRPTHYDRIGLDDYPMGTNAIVAVISYTGYDMEDAMIINKSAYERGFAHGSIYKTEFVELTDVMSYFTRDPNKEDMSQYLDADGLPFIGSILEPTKPFYSYFNGENSSYSTVNYSGKELGYVDNVRLCGQFNLNQPKKVAITIRLQRNPTVGDKFASRAGQKGICSQKWPAEDLPFTESGLIPDIVFNPHGFPSRMTIAMMIETMAGKSGSVHGLVHDASPFRFNENDTAIDYFGRLLEAGGYNYYGTERMYSGIDGREMTADIFFGVVHYQRLRHMVTDKWQVRSTGPIDTLTRQPIKGRRRGGGVRFGEMERDSLISHGTSFLLLDRLFHCSDKTKCLICIKCGTLIGPMTAVIKGDKLATVDTFCRLCKGSGNIAEMEIPYIFKFFVTQLAAVNINVRIKCTTNMTF